MLTISEMTRKLLCSGLSQYDIAKKAGISQPTVCRALSGRRGIRYENGKAIEKLYFKEIDQESTQNEKI